MLHHHQCKLHSLNKGSIFLYYSLKLYFHNFIPSNDFLPPVPCKLRLTLFFFFFKKQRLKKTHSILKRIINFIDIL